MQSQTKNTVMIIIGLMGVMGLFLFSPLLGLGGCTPRPTLPGLTEDAVKTYADFIASRHEEAADFIVRSFDDHDAVFLNNTLYHTTAEQVFAALPRLPDKGVRAVAVDFLLSDDQAEIDALLTAERYDEARAGKLLSYFLMPYAYRDELTLLKNVWSINRGRKAGVPPLRLLGLGLKINFALFTGDAQRDRKDLQRANFNGMTQEEFAFTILDREIFQRKGKVLVWIRSRLVLKNGMQRGFSRFYADIDIPYRGTVSMLARQKLGERVFVVLFHNTWPLESGGSVFPMGGVLDAGMKALPETRTRAAFLSAESPCRDRPFAEDVIGADSTPVPFKDVCDAYLLVGPLYRYRVLPLAPEDMTKEVIMPFLEAQGLKPADVAAYTVEQFISRANQDITAANNEIANLPH